MHPTNGQRFYYPELDGLRFIAFLLVFIHNANPILKGTFLETFSAYSWFGVDLFFCLSAFLLTKLFVLEHQKTGKINIKNFYIRRILRIWPLYFVYIAITIIFTIKHQGWNINIATRAIGLATFTDNFMSSIWGLNFISYSIHLWTVSYENQFYFVIPFAIKKLIKVSRKTKALIIGGAFLVGSVIRAWFIHFQLHDPAMYILPFTRFEAIFIGIAMGTGIFDYEFYKFQKWILLLIGIIFLGFTFALPNKDMLGWSLLFSYPLVGIGVSLITYSIIQKTDFITSFLSNTTISYLGRISYGLYIYHILCLVLAYNFIQQWNPSSSISLSNNLIIFTSGLTLSILFASLSYRILERPFLIIKGIYTQTPSRPL